MSDASRTTSGLQLYPVGVSVGIARRFVASFLETRDVEPAPAVLLVSELASNVVEHASTPFEVVVSIEGGVVRVEFHDGQAVTVAFRTLVESQQPMVGIDATRGRGITLVRSAAARFGLVDKGTQGKMLWFELDLPVAFGRPS
jgi:anti-sigma regulatory factor (Ser/Thr protein kinase)